MCGSSRVDWSTGCGYVAVYSPPGLLYLYALSVNYLSLVNSIIGIQCEYNCGHNKLIYGYIGRDVIPKLNRRQVFPVV